MLYKYKLHIYIYVIYIIYIIHSFMNKYIYIYMHSYINTYVDLSIYVCLYLYIPIYVYTYHKCPKYLKFDWSKNPQYWPYCAFPFNNVLFD